MGPRVEGLTEMGGASVFCSSRLGLSVYGRGGREQGRRGWDMSCSMGMCPPAACARQLPCTDTAQWSG